MKSSDLLGVHEVAEYLGLKRQTVSVYVLRGIMPKPVARLKCGPVWSRGSIDVWQKGRLKR